jgi:hypothetical protein
MEVDPPMSRGALGPLALESPDGAGGYHCNNHCHYRPDEQPPATPHLQPALRQICPLSEFWILSMCE